MSEGRGPRGAVVAIVGATGAVGVELIRCLEERGFPLSELRLFASARSAGKTLTFRGLQLTVREMNEHSFSGVDLALKLCSFNSRTVSCRPRNEIGRAHV